MLKILLATATMSKESAKAKDYTDLNFMQNVRIKKIQTGFPCFCHSQHKNIILTVPIPKYLIWLDIPADKKTSNIS